MDVVDQDSHEGEEDPFHTAPACSSFDNHKVVSVLQLHKAGSTVVVVEEEEVDFDSLDVAAVKVVHLTLGRKVAAVVVVEIE